MARGGAGAALGVLGVWASWFGHGHGFGGGCIGIWVLYGLHGFVLVLNGCIVVWVGAAAGELYTWRHLPGFVTSTVVHCTLLSCCALLCTQMSPSSSTRLGASLDSSRPGPSERAQAIQVRHRHGEATRRSRRQCTTSEKRHHPVRGACCAGAAPRPLPISRAGGRPKGGGFACLLGGSAPTFEFDKGNLI